MSQHSSAEEKDRTFRSSFLSYAFYSPVSVAKLDKHQAICCAFLSLTLLLYIVTVVVMHWRDIHVKLIYLLLATKQGGQHTSMWWLLRIIVRDVPCSLCVLILLVTYVVLIVSHFRYASLFASYFLCNRFTVEGSYNECNACEEGDRKNTVR